MGSGAPFGKMLLGRIVENNTIYAFFWQVRLNKGCFAPQGQERDYDRAPQDKFFFLRSFVIGYNRCTKNRIICSPDVKKLSFYNQINVTDPFTHSQHHVKLCRPYLLFVDRFRRSLLFCHVEFDKEAISDGQRSKHGRYQLSKAGGLCLFQVRLD